MSFLYYKREAVPDFGTAFRISTPFGGWGIGIRTYTLPLLGLHGC